MRFLTDRQLWSPPAGAQTLESNMDGVASTYGTLVTASDTPHTKGGWSELVASTAYDACGISVWVGGTSAASTNTRRLIDVGIGAAASEVVLLPDLDAGNVPTAEIASGGGAMYHFPVGIAAGTRLSARMQALIASDNCRVAVWLWQRPMGRQWVGSRVTAYGVDSAASNGTSVGQASVAYSTPATQIVASCDNPIRAMQLGKDLLTDTTGNNKQGIVRVGIGATPTWIVSDLPFAESTTVEQVRFTDANAILSNMRFDIPAGTRLALSTRVSGSSENRGWIIYGVD